MTDRLDLMKSLLRGAAKAGRDRIETLKPVANLKTAFAELKNRRGAVNEAMLTAAITRATSVRATSVALAEDRVLVDVTFDDDEHVAMAVRVDKARFAPRGAKELLFTVEPEALTRNARAREIVGCIAAAIARALWGPVLGPRDDAEQALVERDGTRLRADLRSIPAVRTVLENSPLAVALDVVSIDAFSVEDRMLRFKVNLPTPFSAP